jgi:hypothetical protein
MEFLTNNALFHCDHNWHAGVVFDAHTFFQGLCPMCDELIPPTFTGICCDCGITHPPYTEILTNSECDFEVMRETNTGINCGLAFPSKVPGPAQNAAMHEQIRPVCASHA